MSNTEDINSTEINSNQSKEIIENEINEQELKNLSNLENDDKIIQNKIENENEIEIENESTIIYSPSSSSSPPSSSTNSFISSYSISMNEHLSSFAETTISPIICFYEDQLKSYHSLLSSKLNEISVLKSSIYELESMLLDSDQFLANYKAATSKQ